MYPVALDTEADTIEIGRQVPPLVCVAVSSAAGKTLFPWYDWESTVESFLRDPEVLIVGHNTGFDMAVMGNECPRLLPLIFDAYEADRIVCTQVRQKLLDIAGGIYRGFDDIEGKTQKLAYSLEDLAFRHLGVKLAKDCCEKCGAKHDDRAFAQRACLVCKAIIWRLSYGTLRRANLPVERWPLEAKEYPLKDTDSTLGAWQVQEQASGYLVDQFRQARAAFWIKLMAAWGLRTDAEGIVALANKTQRKYDAIAEDLRAAGLLKPDRTVKRRTGVVEVEKGSRNVKLVQSLIVDAYSKIGKEAPRTEKGTPETGRVACEESGDPLLIRYAEFASLGKMLSTDIPLLEAGVHAPIHSYFEELKETGRTGSAKPNVQNLPRESGVRECFAPNCLTCGHVISRRDIESGCCQCGAALTVYVGCDYGGLELCTQAQMCKTILGYSTLGDALNAGKDPHLLFASQIRREPYDALYYVRKKRLPKDSTLHVNGECYWNGSAWVKLPSKHDVDDARQTSKVANFGFPGGLGAAALVFFALNTYNVRLTVDEARILKRDWLSTWPEWKEYFAWINAQTNQPFPQVQQLFSGRYRGGVRYTEACNTIFQGLGADIAKAAGWLIARACYVEKDSPLYGCRIVNFIHDEFLLLCPEPRAHEAAQELRRLMLLAARPWLPDVNIDAEPVAMFRYSKEAEPVYIDGRLMGWLPANMQVRREVA